MSEDFEDEVARSVRGVWAPLVLLAVAVSGYVVAGNYSEAAARMPQLVCAVLAILAVIDLYSRVPLPGRRFINNFWGSGFEHREMRSVPGFGREATVIGWMILGFAGLALFGLLPALPAFCFGYVLLEAKRPLKEALLVTAIVFVFQFFVFEIVLDYELYRGLLFSEGGLSKW